MTPKSNYWKLKSINYRNAALCFLVCALVWFVIGIIGCNLCHAEELTGRYTKIVTMDGVTLRDVARKVDVEKIFTSTRSVMNMHPAMPIITVVVHKHAPVGGYVHKTRQIDVALDTLRPGVLAHEFCHSISDFYFAIPPQEPVSEWICQRAEVEFNKRGAK